jgi:hypothetical protein
VNARRRTKPSLAFNAAKGRVLQKLANIRIVKNKWVRYDLDKNDKTKGQKDAFKYAPLEEIDKHLSPLLAEENMDLSYSDEPREGGILIRGRLKHLPSGHYEDSFMAAPLDTTGGKSNVQAVGSTNSYLRRYVACNIFNIVVIGDDDDGRGGLLTEEQVRQIVSLIGRAAVNVAKFLEFMGAQSVEDAGSLEAAVGTIAAKDFAKARVTLEERIKKHASAAKPGC